MSLTDAELERFMSKVDTSGDCWEWTAFRLKIGYGRFGLHQKVEQAHRVSFEHFHRKLEPGECVCHACDNPGCVNPDHLWAGSQKDNVADMTRKGRYPHRQGMNNKIAVDQVEEIRADSRTQQEIAKSYGITQAQVSQIKLRKSWAWL